jgi:hypothetical protein
MSCSNGSEPDVWTKVTNLNQLEGTWEGSETETVEGDDGVIASIKMTIKVQYPVTEGGVTGLKMTEIIDMTDFVEKSAKVNNVSAEEVWEAVKVEVSAASGIALSDERPYTMTTALFVPQEIVLESLTTGNSSLFVNESNTKLKLVDYAGDDTENIILYKK